MHYTAACSTLLLSCSLQPHRSTSPKLPLLHNGNCKQTTNQSFPLTQHQLAQFALTKSSQRLLTPPQSPTATMHAHRLDSYLIAPNVKLEIVHENNPFFTGERVSFIVRLKHLGSLQEFDHLNHSIHNLQHEVHQRLNNLNPVNDVDNHITQDNVVNPIDTEILPNTDNTSVSNTIAQQTLNRSWSVKSIWSNVFRRDIDASNNNNNNNNNLTNSQSGITKDEQKQLNQWNKDLSFHAPVNLMAGFIQIAGVCQYNIETINESSLKIKGKKIIGMLNHSNILLPKDNSTNQNQNEIDNHNSITDSNNNKDFLTNKYLDSDFQPVMNLNKQLIIAPNSALNNNNLKQIIGDNDENFNEIPICIIPQSLLFSEIQLRPGETKIYQFKSDYLPKDLCPSYSTFSKNINIHYSLEFGTNIMKGNNIIPYNLKLPITIAPYINSNSEQFLNILDRDSYILKPATIKDISIHSRRLESSMSIQLRKKSVSSINSTQQKIDNQRHSDLKKSFKKLVLDTLNNDTEKNTNNNNEKFDIDDLVEYQVSKQFDESTDLNNEINNDFTDESPIDVSNRTIKSTKSVKDIINDLRTFIPTENSTNTDEKGSSNQDINNDVGNPDNAQDKSTDLNTKTIQLIPQLTTTIRKDYVINRNGNLLAKVKFSQLFYTNLENIDMVIYLQENNDFKITGIKISLQRAELFNKKYITERASAKPFYWSVCHAECTSFDTAQSIPLKLIIPKSPMNQIPSQFKTDVFEIKWVLYFQFILVMKSRNMSDSDLEDENHNFTLSKHYEDKTGSVYNSKRTLEGEEFAFRMPITILPPDSDFGGW